jgi:hypothetical protein
MVTVTDEIFLIFGSPAHLIESKPIKVIVKETGRDGAFRKQLSERLERNFIRWVPFRCPS